MTDMDHVGTRMQHMIDLYELWNSGLEVVEHSESIHESPMGKAHALELKHALNLLDNYMQKGYSPFNTYSREINTSPRAERIEGGRGSELRYDPPKQSEGEDPN